MSGTDLNATSSPLTVAALAVHARGWTPVLLVPKEKRPIESDWPQITYPNKKRLLEVLTRTGITADCGLGVRLGGGLADVDLDSPSSRRVAPLGLLPPTPARSGRSGSPMSHWWYRLTGPNAYDKHVDHLGAVLVELRASSGIQTAVPPTVHPSGQPYVWEGVGPWGGADGPAEVALADLRARVAMVAVVAMLADTWPREGSRHDAHVALAGALLRGAHHDRLWVDLVSDALRALAAATNDGEQRVQEAVPSTVRALDAGRPATGWTRLAEFVGAEVVPAAQRSAEIAAEAMGVRQVVTLDERSPKDDHLLAERVAWHRADRQARRLVDAEEDEADDGEDWAPVSLVDAERVPAPEVLRLPDGSCLARRGWVTLVHGQRGSAKTPLCYLAVVEQVKAGHAAVVVDYEMGRSGARSLLNDLGLSDDEIASGVYFAESPGAMTPVKRRRLADELERLGRRVTVVVIDSLTEAMAVVPGRLSDNDAQDVMAWFNSLPKWAAREFDAAVLVIDHSNLSDSERPSGSHKKREVPQAHVWVQAKTPFSRAHEDGYSNLSVQKDRSGDRVLGEVFARIRTRMGASFYLEAPDAPRTGLGTIEVPLDRQLDLADREDVMRDARSAGTEGQAKTKLTGDSAAGTQRRTIVNQLIREGVIVERRVGREKRCWAAEFAPDES